VPDVDRSAGSGAVEVDDVKRAGTLVDPAPGRVERVGVVDGLTLVIPLEQPHRASVADVDRWIEDHL
jgi:hypothetical protein